MKQTHKIAYDFAQALKHQRAAEDLVHQAFRTLGSENQIFGLAEPLEGAYADLVSQLLTPELFDWTLWWMYETDYGTQPTSFSINNVTYDPTTMTLYRFLEIVDAS